MATPKKLLSIPLWLPKWSEQNLFRLAQNDARGYARGYRLRAYSDEEKTFPSFGKCLANGAMVQDFLQRKLIFSTGVDLSSKTRPGNAIVTLGLDPLSSLIYPVDVVCGAWKSPETCEHLASVNTRFDPLAITVEDNAYQASLIEWVQAMKGANNFWAKIEPSTTTSGAKLSDEFGLPAIEIELSNGAWQFPAGEWTFPSGRRAYPEDGGTRGVWARFRNEFEHHPFAPASDFVMAAWFARQGLRKFGALKLGMSVTTMSHSQ